MLLAPWLKQKTYRAGDSNTASAQADSVLPIAQEVTIASQRDKQTAIVSGQKAFWTTIAFTIIALTAFLLVLLLVWRWFKKRYIKKLSNAKPEVRTNES